MTGETADIRCPKCRRLLAKKQPSGEVVIRRRGEPVAVIYTGMACCPKCRVEVRVNSGRQAPVDVWTVNA